uniref:Succinyl-diaminopimelate desuccinylase n=1 Tax=Glossina pallidipes TaxID=7398 RepID=A0A1A9Z123_GLOPL
MKQSYLIALKSILYKEIARFTRIWGQTLVPPNLLNKIISVYVMLYHDPVVNLTHNLIKCPSLTPNEAGCNKIIIDYLLDIGFKIEIMQFGTVQNIWAYRGSGYTFLFSGHTDVVHVGNLKYWKYPPFEPTLNNGLLYGRGAADMKGALSA